MRNRRHAVPFDPEHFARQAALGEAVSPIEAFRYAYETNFWTGPESPSGPGSGFDQTAVIRRALPELCHRLGVRSFLDLPCGDCHWVSTIDFGRITYMGGDLLPELIDANTRRFAQPGREFRVLDLLSSPLPPADLVLCRDCLVHLSFEDIARAVTNLRAAGATYLLTTTFPLQLQNDEIRTGDWRPLNLETDPFRWSRPQELILEECTEAGGEFADKSLGLWRMDALPVVGN